MPARESARRRGRPLTGAIGLDAPLEQTGRADDDRTQRHTLCLRDVAYIIKANINLKSHADAHPAKYRDQFRRRVARGQCHHQP